MRKSLSSSRTITKIIKLQARARINAYTYFITRAGTDYRWHLVDRDDNDIAMSAPFRDKADCLKSLRANQRHGATPDVRDETR